MTRSWEQDIDTHLAELRELARVTHEARGGRWPFRRADERDELAELRAAVMEAQAVSRVLRGQLQRYEQLVRVDSWRDVVTVAIPAPASCGHPADEGEAQR